MAIRRLTSATRWPSIRRTSSRHSDLGNAVAARLVTTSGRSSSVYVVHFTLAESLAGVFAVGTGDGARPPPGPGVRMVRALNVL
jgi:hypothetical protein